MRIRDEIVGPEHDAVELYPRRSREVDRVNHYHLWIVASDKCGFPFGFSRGRDVRREAPAGYKQRPFEPDDYEMAHGGGAAPCTIDLQGETFAAEN
jgi:hypothetical protein